MDVVSTIAAFKKQLKIKGYADKTIESYRWGLDQFRQWLQERDIDDLRNVTRHIIREYQAAIMQEPLCMESKAVKIRPVKRLFEHLTDDHQLLINPAEGIVETCRQNRKIGTVLTVEEMRKLLDQPEPSLPSGIRDKAIMEVLYSTGMRANELLQLQVYDPDLQDKVVFIKGKGKKERVVPIGNHTAQHLNEYLKKVRPRYARKNKEARTLFLTVEGLPMTWAALRRMIRKYRLAAGITGSVSAHTFRRSCATHLLQQGADIRYIQKLLGHKYLRTTQQYTRILPTEVKTIHAGTHPGIGEDKDDEDQRDHTGISETSGNRR